MAKRSTRIISAALLAFLAAGEVSAGRAERFREQFNQQTVMIRVTHRDQSESRGAGVVLCQEDGRVYVATARGLLAGEAPGGGKLLRHPARTEIRFFDDALPSFVDERAAAAGPDAAGVRRGLTFHQAPEDDLVLLSFPFQPLAWTAATRRRFEVGSSRGIFANKEPAVSAVGYLSSSREVWAHRLGKLLAEGGKLLYHSAPIDQGFVGGPLFNKRWLIGINLRLVSGEEIGAEDGTYGEALSVKQLLPAIGKWLPARCQQAIAWRVDAFLPPSEAEEGPKVTALPPLALVPPVAQAGTTGEGAQPEGRADPPPPEASVWEDPAALSQAFQTAIAEERRLAALSAPFEERTVMITVTADDRVDYGAGVVLCEDDRQAYVLTAHHLLAGKRPAGEESAPRRSGRIEIQFFHQSVPAVVDDRAAGQAAVVVHPLPEVDLALLSIPALGEAVARPSLVRPSAWARADGRPGLPVLAVGYRKAPLEAWATERGALLAGDGGRLRHSAPLVEGFSGGPLFHRSGALLGINLERVAGEALGAEAGRFYGEALPIEQILPRIRPWLPPSCLETMEAALDRSLLAIPATRFLAEAGRMEQFGSDREPRFGPYRVTDFHGGALRQLFSRTRATRKYRFSFHEPNDVVWQVRCSEKIEAEEEGPGLLNFLLDQELDTSLVVAVESSLDCTFEREGGEESMGLVLAERDSSEEIAGGGTLGSVRIAPVGTGSAVHYLLHSDGHLLGALVAAEGYSVRLAPGLTEETRSACAAAAAALLLHAGFGRPAEDPFAFSGDAAF